MSGEDQREMRVRSLAGSGKSVGGKKWEDEGKILISDAPRLFLHLVNHFTKLLVSSFFPNMRSHTNFLLSSSCLLYARTHARTHLRRHTQTGTPTLTQTYTHADTNYTHTNTWHIYAHRPYKINLT